MGTSDRNRSKNIVRRERETLKQHQGGLVSGADMLAGMLGHAPGRAQLEQKVRRRLEPPASCTPDQEEQLAALWATLPDIDCRGQCWDSCGPIRMTGPERALAKREGFDIPDAVHDGNAYLCPALTMLKRCAVYDVRPMICRLWGISDSMPCNYGCQPTSRGRLTDRETWAALAEGFRIAGDVDAADKILECWATPERAAETDTMLRESREADQTRREVAVLRAQRRGGITYVEGPGRISKQPARGTQQ